MIISNISLLLFYTYIRSAYEWVFMITHRVYSEEKVSPLALWYNAFYDRTLALRPHFWEIKELPSHLRGSRAKISNLLRHVLVSRIPVTFLLKIHVPESRAVLISISVYGSKKNQHI